MKLPNNKVNFKQLSVVLMLTTLPFAVFADEKKLDLYDVVKSTLDNSQDLKIQGYKVDISKAIERIQGGAFNVKTAAKASYDSTKNTSYVDREKYTQLSPPPGPGITTLGVADADTQSFQASLEKKFRTGITTKLQYDLSRRDPVGHSATATDYAYGTTSRGKVSLTITVPLLKGGWEVSAGAAEKAAGLDYQAAAANYKQAITKTLLDTINAYWVYTAKYEVLHQRILIRDRIEKWVNSNKLNSFLSGFLQEKYGFVATATQDLENARLDLAKSMGITPDEAQKLGTPDPESFPKDPEKTLEIFDTAKAKQEWVELALENRNDYRATKLSVESTETLLAKDQQDLYPELTAAVNVGYNGITHGNGFDTYTNASYKNVRDLDHSASLTFSYPLGNDAAEGVYDQDQAKKMTNVMTMNNSARVIKLNIEKAIATLSGRLKVVVQAKKTAYAYRDSLRDLFKNSDLTSAEQVSGIVVLQQKLENAIVDYINAQGDYANAIAQARYEAGVLVSNAENSDLKVDINLAKVTSYPTPATK